MPPLVSRFTTSSPMSKISSHEPPFFEEDCAGAGAAAPAVVLRAAGGAPACVVDPAANLNFVSPAFAPAGAAAAASIQLSPTAVADAGGGAIVCAARGTIVEREPGRAGGGGAFCAPGAPP